MDDDADRARLVEKLGLAFPVLADAGRAATDAYGVREAGTDHPRPATFVLDADHRVVYAHVGANAGDRPAWQAIVEAVPGP